MIARNITKNDVLSVLNDYESIEEQDEIVLVYSKLLYRENKNYLYRVFVNNGLKPVKVITI